MEEQRGRNWGLGSRWPHGRSKGPEVAQPALHSQTTYGGPSRRGFGLRGPSHPVPRGGGQGAGHGPGWRKWGQDPGGQTPLGLLISRVPVMRCSPGSRGRGPGLHKQHGS